MPDPVPDRGDLEDNCAFPNWCLFEAGFTEAMNREQARLASLETALREMRELVEEMTPYMENHPRTHAKRIGEPARAAIAAFRGVGEAK